MSFLQNLTYGLALKFFNLLLFLFFREVRPRGAHKIPKTGAVIFVVAPHANQVKENKKPKPEIRHVFLKK